MHSQSTQMPHPPTSTESFLSSKSSRVSSKFREHVARRRCWLGIVAGLLLLLMCLGVVFAAHHYYTAFGGQGFLRTRHQYAASQIVDAPNLYLPLRKVATFHEHHSASARNIRSPMEVPYYSCGDQQHSCEAYNQPNICCPVTMSCFPTPFTASDIYCCNSNEPSRGCFTSWTQVPKCLTSYFECSNEEGGGCCPTNTTCSPTGCIKITCATTIEAPTSTVITTGVVTVTEVPAATATIVKQGEVAQSGVGPKDSAVLGLCLPYSCVSILVFIAVLMGFL